MTGKGPLVINSKLLSISAGHMTCDQSDPLKSVATLNLIKHTFMCTKCLVHTWGTVLKVHRSLVEDPLGL